MGTVRESYSAAIDQGRPSPIDHLNRTRDNDRVLKAAGSLRDNSIQAKCGVATTEAYAPKSESGRGPLGSRNVMLRRE